MCTWTVPDQKGTDAVIRRKENMNGVGAEVGGSMMGTKIEMASE